MSTRWKCPHCGGSIVDQVNRLIADTAADGATTYVDCRACGRGFSVALLVDVSIGVRSFAEDHPALAERWREPASPEKASVKNQKWRGER